MTSVEPLLQLLQQLQPFQPLFQSLNVFVFQPFQLLQPQPLLFQVVVRVAVLKVVIGWLQPQLQNLGVE